jgi:hypothetical protein
MNDGSSLGVTKKYSYNDNDVKPIVGDGGAMDGNHEGGLDGKSTPDSHNRYKRNIKKEDVSKISSLKGRDELHVELEPTHKDLMLNNISNIENKNESDRVNTIEEVVGVSIKKKAGLVKAGGHYGDHGNHGNHGNLDAERNLETIDIHELKDMRSRDGARESITSADIAGMSPNNPPVKPEDRLHYLAITSIIPEQKLLSSSDDDIMFQSNLKRLLNQKVNNHISQNFCDRFMICTKNTLKLYKSKEQFLKLSKPVNIIPFTNIKSSNRFSLNHYSNMKLHFFVIEFHEKPAKGKHIS